MILDTISTAIEAVSYFDNVPIIWEAEKALPFGDTTLRLPLLTATVKTSDVTLASTDCVRITHDVRITFNYINEYEQGSLERQAEYMVTEKACRKIALMCGYLHSTGETTIELDETTIGVIGSTGGDAKVCGTTVNFQLIEEESIHE